MSSAGFIRSRAIPDNELSPEKMHRARTSKYVRDLFDVQPSFYALPLGYGNPAGTTGAVNGIRTRFGQYEWHVKGAGQTILAPVYDLANGLGLNIAQDLTATEGAEYLFSPSILGTNPARGVLASTIGTDDAFFAKWKIRIADASGLNPLFVGFRLFQAYQTALDTYTDYFGFNCVVNGAVADVFLRSKLNNAAAVSTDTTQDIGDATVRTFEVRVSKGGVAQAFLDNAFPTVNRTGYTFDAGDVVVPCLFLLHGAAAPGAVYLQEFEAGYLARRPGV